MSAVCDIRGDVSQADARYSALGKLPAGTVDRGGSNGHFVTWTTGRLVGPERARDAPRSRPETPRSGVEAGVTAGVARNGTRSEGGVYQKQSGGCNTPPFRLPPSLLGFVVINRLPRTAPAVRGKTGATPVPSK